MRGFDVVTLVVHWFKIQLLCMLIIFCAKKKQNRLTPNTSQTKANIGQAAGGGAQTNPASNQPTPAKTETPKDNDDDDEPKFEINIKKPEEKKDEFDDDEENPLAKIAMKPKNKNGQQGKKNAGGQAKNGEKNLGKAVKTKEEVGQERPFLAPNEKQTAVSCYQFEPSQQAPAPQQTTAPKKAAPMQKSTDGGPRTANTRTVVTAPTAPTAPASVPLPTAAPVAAPAAGTPIPAPSTTLLPNIDANTKSTLSLTGQKKAKTLEQERTNNDPVLEKTQKADGEAK